MPNYKNESNQIRYDFRNPHVIQNFEVGDSFYFNGEILRICYVSSMYVTTETGDGHYFTLDDAGMTLCVKTTLDELIDHYADQDMIIKVKATGFEDGFVIYTPVYEK